MKEVILFSALLLLLIFPGYSQTKLGLKAGVNWATMDFKNNFANSYHYRTGFHVGASVERSIGEKAFVRSELFYSRKGYEARSIRFPDNKSTTDFDYLNIPLLVGYKLPSGISFYLGPEVSYNLGNTVKPKTKKDFDFGVDGGILYSFTDALSFDLRYTYGFVKMSNVKSVNDGEPLYDGQNRVAQLGVNYYFKKR
jgi:opacity protein-like surface antigen